jgi:hypothetical protein
MKTLSLIVIAVLATSSFSFSQTKRIMHRSHSGSDASLWMDDSEDSFGLSRPMQNEMRKQSDSTAAAQKKADSINAVKATKKAPQKKSNLKKKTTR